MIPKDEQLEAVLTARLWDLAQRYAGGDYHRAEAMLTFTLDELVAYAREHDLPAEGWFRREPATYDGVYLVADGDGFAVYRQERGEVIAGPDRFDGEPAAFEHVLATYYMPRS